MRRHLAYFRYVMRHKVYVFLAGLEIRVPIWQLIIHDWHKFTPAEWFPYARTFYSREGEKQYRPDVHFDMAWNAHQKRGKHHWQYWVLTKDEGKSECLPMPERFWREMVADWHGAGVALGKPDIHMWYAQNYDNIQLHPDTRKRVDALLGMIFEDDLLDDAITQAEGMGWSVQTRHEAALRLVRHAFNNGENT